MDRYDPDSLPKDAAFDLARAEQRRIVVRLLLDEPREWDVRALADAVAARKSDDRTDGEETKRVQVELLHRDLPKLADHDVIDYDIAAGTVAPGEPIDDLAPLV